jgi:putative transcription factor
MVECELCGSKATRRAKVEGSILDVCDECVKFGEEIPRIEIKRKKRKVPQLESEEVLIKDFHKIIRRSRENRKLTQVELAKKLKEKVSVVKRVEDGWEPPVKLIEKIEKYFKIKLREKIEEKSVNKKTDSKKLTIGDIVEVS